MRILVTVLLAISLAFILSGCAGVLNPYADEFACPKTYKGKCVSIQQAYDESLNPDFKEPEDKGYLYEMNSRKKSCTGGSCSNSRGTSGAISMDTPHSISDTGRVDTGKGEGAYFDGLYKKMSSLIKEPVSPLIAPPKVMRVLIFSYSDDSDELFMPRYVYFMADKPRWLLLDPALNMEELN